MNNSQPTSLQPYSSDQDEAKVNIDEIIQKSKLQCSEQLSQIQKNQPEHQQHKVQDQNLEEQEKQLDQIELEMLVEECEELISKISPNIYNFCMQEQATVISDVDQSFSMKREKNRLQKQYMQLCLQIQRQQKELQNYRFKVQLARKQAQYYTRQIKQKTEILQNLQQHSNNHKKGRQSFRK